MLNYVTNVKYLSTEKSSTQGNNLPLISSSSSTEFSSLSSSNFSTSSPPKTSSSRNILNNKNYNDQIRNNVQKKTCKMKRDTSKTCSVNEEMDKEEIKMGFLKAKQHSYDEESEADSGIADSSESPAVKGKNNVWSFSAGNKKSSADEKRYDDVFKKPEIKHNGKPAKSKESFTLNNTVCIKKPSNYVVQYTKEEQHDGRYVVLSSAALSEDQREGRYERKYNSSASLHHRNAAKRSRMRRSVVATKTNDECGIDTNQINNNVSMSNNQKVINVANHNLSNYNVRNGNNHLQENNIYNGPGNSEMSKLHTQKESQNSNSGNISEGKLPARRKLFSCPEESDMDQSFTSLKISAPQRFLSADQRNSRSDGWKSIFKTSQRVRSAQNSAVKSGPIKSHLNSSFDHSKSFTNVELTPFKKEGAFLRSAESRTSGGLFNSLSRIFKRNKRKSETNPKDSNNNTLPLKRVHVRNSSGGSDLSQQFNVSRSSSETVLNSISNLSFSASNCTQERLVTEPFHSDKRSLNSCRVALLSSKYAGACTMRQALVDFNRWSSVLLTFSSLLINNKNLSNEDFIAKRSAFKRSTKTFVINIKNTLVNFESGSFVDCVRLSCCISYADVVSCCCFVLDFISLPSDRKRLTDSVTALGRTFHATVSTSPAYLRIYSENDHYDELKAKKLSENVQKVIEHSKQLAFLIDSIRYNQLNLKF